MSRFLGQTVLITGGNSGIGFAIAQRFAQEGANLILLGRDTKKGTIATEKINALGSECQFIQCDLSQEDNIKEVIERIPSLDVLVNNAGLGTRRTEVDHDNSPSERWHTWRGANLDSTYLMSAFCLPLLKKNAGSIVNISSTAAIHGNWGLYGVAKAGVEALTRSFACEASPVRVNGVSPGWVLTEATAHAAGKDTDAWDIPPSLLNRMGTGAEIASVVAFLASADASFITGQTLVVDGGLTITDYPSRAMLEKVGSNLFSQD
ncbi:SDR family NAD(P)-dependent oxidoreductase [Cochlodiniinecator piscidefendens]|uniref:SDR family NAD(P)-dependent oxidoreductase n=1 Tax=Cochlodiniinecator piscidefendens TaxID=2715756 RepID=UPI001408B773|nr:SDR family NAD(P)-dependent oxidoreductase [Cochlodiniinecator piscidefendens]